MAKVAQLRDATSQHEHCVAGSVCFRSCPSPWSLKSCSCDILRGSAQHLHPAALLRARPLLLLASGGRLRQRTISSTHQSSGVLSASFRMASSGRLECRILAVDLRLLQLVMAGLHFPHIAESAAAQEAHNLPRNCTAFLPHRATMLRDYRKQRIRSKVTDNASLLVWRVPVARTPCILPAGYAYKIGRFAPHLLDTRVGWVIKQRITQTVLRLWIGSLQTNMKNANPTSHRGPSYVCLGLPPYVVPRIVPLRGLLCVWTAPLTPPRGSPYVVPLPKKGGYRLP